MECCLWSQANLLYHSSAVVWPVLACAKRPLWLFGDWSSHVKECGPQPLEKLPGQRSPHLTDVKWPRGEHNWPIVYIALLLNGDNRPRLKTIFHIIISQIFTCIIIFSKSSNLTRISLKTQQSKRRRRGTKWIQSSPLFPSKLYYNYNVVSVCRKSK